MGIFKKKEPYDCKILERYRINIGKTNLEFMNKRNSNISHGHQAHCEFLVEDDNYRFYNYNIYSYVLCSDFDHGWVLRQDKKHPRRTVYFGRNKTFNCVFKGYLFQVDSLGFSGFGADDFGVSARNIENGQYIYFGWLSNRITIGAQLGGSGSSHFQYQDVVNYVKVEDDKLIIKVTREKSGDTTDEFDIDCDYVIEVVFNNGQFKAKAVFPRK